MTETSETTQVLSPEAARAFLAAPVFLPGFDAATAGELLAGFFAAAWETEPTFADWKSVLYVAGVHAGLFSGMVTGDGWLADVDPRAPRIVPQVIAAAIRAMGQPAVDVDADLLPASADLQVGGNLVSPQPDKWWCDCDDMVGPHVHCVFGGRGPHKHAVEVPPDHREPPKRGSRG